MAYCTLADVKLYLGITEPDDDALIEQAILTAKAAIDRYCGTSFDVTTDTTKYFSSLSPLISGRALHLGRDCVAQAPTLVMIGSVNVTAAVKLYGTAPYWELVLSGASGYSWYDCNDLDPEDVIAITGRWGYSVTPPDDIKQAAIIWSSHFYQIKDASADGTLPLNTSEVQQPKITAAPGNALTLLAPYRGLF